MKSVPVFGQKDTYLRNYVQEWNDATKEEARKALLCYKRFLEISSRLRADNSWPTARTGGQFGWGCVVLAMTNRRFTDHGGEV